MKIIGLGTKVRFFTVNEDLSIPVSETRVTVIEQAFQKKINPSRQLHQ